MTTTPSPAPSNLAARGKSFWTQTSEQYDLSDAERHVLAECCHTMDTLDILAAQIAADGVMIHGAAGQEVLHPAISEARAQRVVLHRLLAALALPDPEGATVPTTATLRAKRAASVRWSGHRKDVG